MMCVDKSDAFGESRFGPEEGPTLHGEGRIDRRGFPSAFPDAD